MPVFSIYTINPQTKLGIWKIDESIQEVISIAEMNGIPPIQAVSHPSMQLQKYCTSLLLHEMDLHILHKLFYSPNGQPLLTYDMHISISHNPFFCAALISQTPCGIDIEPITSKAFRIRHKFLSLSEIDMLLYNTANNNEVFTLAWCVKEAVFKWYGKGQVLFIEDIQLTDFKWQENKGIAEVFFRKEAKSVLLQLKKMGACVFAYLIEE